MRLTWTVVLVSGAVLGLFLSSIGCETAKRAQAGVVIDKTGAYRSPGGDGVAKIAGQEDKMLSVKVDFFEPDGKLRGGTEMGRRFAPDSGWFACWDTQDRFWFYIPDGQHGRCYVASATPGSTGVGGPGEYGGWEGIPEAFLNRLPKRLQDIQAKASKRPAP